jgi:membrane associated rhomboid family serine protease
MLEDRSYMRESSDDPRHSLSLLLIVVLIAVFVLQYALFFYAGFDILPYGGLSNAGLAKGKIWQLVTFQFLHWGPWPWHLLFNCLGLYFFGREVEQAVGRSSFLRLYFVSGISGGLLQSLTTFLLPNHPDVSVVGASAGVLGLVAAFAALFPERDLMFWILFFPVRLKAKYLLWFSALLSIYGTIIPFDNVAHAAHLGGIAAGLAYLRWGMQAESFLAQRRRNRPRLRPRELMKVPLGKAPWQRAKGEAVEMTRDEFISQEVDPILDKISAHGIHSLTPRERQILEAARAKMDRR